jgi:hypothetical protein
MARFIRKAQSSSSSQRYLFELTLHQVDLRVPYEVEVGVLFRCGTKRQTTKLAPKINQTNSIADFQNEKLTLLSSLAKDKESGEL